MNQRARIVMTEDEITAFVGGSRKLQLGTVNPDGTPHMVTMFYGLTEGAISFWTYGKAQKARNIQRDARVSCLIEAGEEYAELRGVLMYGTARRIDDSEGVLKVGMDVARRMAGMPEAEELLTEYVAYTGRKRVAFVVEPTRVISWDHRKLTTSA
ncbi:nitroimidazol reductase NimA-like FMN-containing flavoprotein (pyridoxamine 5'-phosphate oxidase superfamily) [Streptosporangium album]|uniref:Nitroimidazol reductase NimA-like FMN-containing flavoprotein (Pyridoxamine 5'-phosphate oxidase superfamily) n=1 Tax=Streptosporangium album TaxID=47479 RepID=A0A7W7RTG7_9ACTN|nr:pyridoxamine 5'-phosphate oxidase family protein [Streptosporangium album]MBB4937268.1 nitroimidazol reductase NimA-like FMN-containing flavoprotein (pyridoxamine 5'-phosphate oxidase superfamily) [Streptosporangium album]